MGFTDGKLVWGLVHIFGEKQPPPPVGPEPSAPAPERDVIISRSVGVISGSGPAASPGPDPRCLIGLCAGQCCPPAHESSEGHTLGICSVSAPGGRRGAEPN